MLIRFPTEKTVSDAAAALQVAVPANHFNTPQLEAVAQEVEATIVKIMQEAASP